MENVTLVTAFIAGIISFISPCVLPIVPGYISFVSGVSLQELKGQAELDKEKRRRLLWKTTSASALFVLGFSVVFIAMGASATYVGQWFAENRLIMARVAGVIIIIFGLHIMGITPIKASRSKTSTAARRTRSGSAWSLLARIGPPVSRNEFGNQSISKLFLSREKTHACGGSGSRSALDLGGSLGRNRQIAGAIRLLHLPARARIALRWYDGNGTEHEDRHTTHARCRSGSRRVRFPERLRGEHQSKVVHLLLNDFSSPAPAGLAEEASE